jgi:hypothetical protein
LKIVHNKLTTNIPDKRSLKLSLTNNYLVRWHYAILLGGFLLCLLFFGAFSFYLGAEAHRKSIIRGEFLSAVTDIISENYNIPLNYIHSFFSVPNKIIVDIKFKHLQRLEFNREASLKSTRIPEKIKKINYPAKLTFNNKSMAASISLYGTNLDHVNSDQYSLRIKIKNNTIMGMSNFILMNPKVRYGLYDWIAHKMMKYENLISLRYKLVSMTLNGEDKGVYILEELFDKRLIENNRQREGLILKLLQPLKIYDEKKLLLDPSTKQSVHLIKQLFESIIQGDLRPKQLFDYDKMSRFLALVKLIGGEHALFVDNIRFYFNPITAKLEPIGREFNIKTNVDVNIFRDKLYKRFLDDPEFVKLYVQQLYRLSKPNYLDTFFSKYELELQKAERIIHRQLPYHSLRKNYFYEQQNIIKSELTLANENIKTTYVWGKNRLDLLFENSSSYPLKISRFFSSSKILNNLFNQSLDSNLIIATGKTPLSIKIPSINVQEISDSLMSTQIYFNIYGLKKQLISQILPLSKGQTIINGLGLMRKSPNPENFSFIQLTEDKKEINITQGNWTIENDMILPPGFIVTSFPDTKLNLINGASIVSYSPLNFYGTEDNPIIIESSDGKGRGLVVIKTGARASKFYHVVFRNLTRPKELGWTLTSAVTFFESDVHFVKSAFLGNHDSDDALNIFRSNFSIENSIFAHSFADALDIDFSNGSITDVIFRNCGAEDKNGDCLDVSGSTVELNNINFNKSGDKALSIGEKSSVTANNISISNAKVAIASKDSSEIKLDQLTIRDSSFGFAVYQKKKEFGPASIITTNFSSESVGTLYLIGDESSLNINGTSIIQSSKINPLDRIAESFKPSHTEE